MKNLSSANINYIRTGPRGGTPVVLLHAIGTDLTFWMPQIANLSQTFDVIAFDLPGHGLSPQLIDDLSFDRFADVIAKAIEDLNVKNVHLAGISFGGMVAQKIAILYAESVRSLTLISTTCTFSPEIRTALQERAAFTESKGMQVLAPLTLKRWFSTGFTMRRPDVIDWITKLLYKQDATYHAALWQMISTLDIAQELAKLALPAMVIVGEEDASTPVAAANYLAKLLKTERLHVLPFTAHLPTLEEPGKINELLEGFFNSIFPL
jgi:3-oxoadipate enol-lactonase